MAGRIPNGAVAASVVVLVYSIPCLTLNTLLVCLLWSFGERWTYVTIFSAFTAISTFGSMIQQLHYASNWKVIKQAQFDQAIQSLKHPGLAFGRAAEKADIVLFYIQFYCYNVMSLNILFWAVALFVGMRLNRWGEWSDRMGPISKVFSVLFPAIIVGLMQIEAIVDSVPAFFAVSNITMLVSMTSGTILLILILYKYVKTRRLIAGLGVRGGWWASNGSKGQRPQNTSANGTSGTVQSGVTSSIQRSIYDRALVTRFTIGFAILVVFEIAIIVFNLFQFDNNAAIAASGQPNTSVSGAIIDILFFIPGATASLVAFLVFGTTKSWRQYYDLVIGGCGLRNRILQKQRLRLAEEGVQNEGLELQRLPSLPTWPPEEDKGKYAEHRVRMFVRESTLSSNLGSSSYITGPPSSQENTPRVLQVHTPLPSISTTSKEPTSGIIEVGLAIDRIDQVIQYKPGPGTQDVEKVFSTLLLS